MSCYERCIPPRTMTLKNLTTFTLLYSIMCADAIWIEIYWNSIWFRVWLQMTLHYTWGPVTILHDFGSVVGWPLCSQFGALGFCVKWPYTLFIVKGGSRQVRILRVASENIQNQHLSIFGQTTCPKIIRYVHLWGQKHQMTTTKTTTTLHVCIPRSPTTIFM